MPAFQLFDARLQDYSKLRREIKEVKSVEGRAMVNKDMNCHSTDGVYLPIRVATKRADSYARIYLG